MCGQEALRVIADSVAHVVFDEVSVERDGGHRACAGGGDDLGARVGDVPGRPDSRNACPSRGVGGDPAVGVQIAAKADEQAIVANEARRDEQCVPGTTQPSLICTPRSLSSSMTSCSMVPSMTPMARATNWSRSTAVRLSGGVK